MPPREASSTDDVKYALLRLIREAGFHPGERVGSERQLSAALGTTRERLRRVLDELEAEHRIRRATGRTGGVFADDGRIQRQLNTTESVPALLRQQGKSVETHIIRGDIALATPYECRNLDIEPGTGVFRLERLRVVDGRPWSLERSTMPARRFPGIATHDYTGSLYGILEQHYATRTSTAKETLEVAFADADQAMLLEVSIGHPLIEIRRIAYDMDDAPFELAHDLFRADRTRVHTQRYGANWKRSPDTRSAGGSRPGHTRIPPSKE
ncbi:GntR family transcriptional regulator [Raineyella sp. LH-20]|uniref:GntR family transcriptional regulator n=1 Tax=Raineyella sp. LH-20 TaxID=3081204 RepID=UPI00295490BE|nr:GntR family transcriptional regulator [Raineyella sp. LH-20]WOP17734.1 GntR family transcriptional regulator [Raineyella sp. LH-20]